MGRRTEWENGSHPIEEKIVEIVARADYRGIRFGDIVDLAKEEGISRPSVARHLSMLVDNGILKKDGGYKLSMEAINWKHAQRNVFSVLAMHLFDDVFEKTGQGILSDDQFVELFTRRVGILALYTILVGLEKASKNNPAEGGRWIEEAFGSLVQKDGWRMCVDRQVFGEIVTLKTPIRLERPLRPQIEIEEGTIYVRSPEAIKRGLAGRVLRELSKPIPKDRLNLLKKSLKNLYPTETQTLDDAFNLIMTAAAHSKRG
jgi:DNA-binding Lrp family transcriptional regulator